MNARVGQVGLGIKATVVSVGSYIFDANGDSGFSENDTLQYGQRRWTGDVAQVD